VSVAPKGVVKRPRGQDEQEDAIVSHEHNVPRLSPQSKGHPWPSEGIIRDFRVAEAATHLADGGLPGEYCGYLCWAANPCRRCVKGARRANRLKGKAHRKESGSNIFFV